MSGPALGAEIARLHEARQLQPSGGMTRTHDGGIASAVQDGERDDWHPAPGKRTLTQGLQRRAAAPQAPTREAAATTTSPPRPVAHAYEDPFGLHLSWTARDGGGT